MVIELRPKSSASENGVFSSDSNSRIKIGSLFFPTMARATAAMVNSTQMKMGELDRDDFPFSFLKFFSIER